MHIHIKMYTAFCYISEIYVLEPYSFLTMNWYVSMNYL